MGVLNAWRARTLSLKGKALVVNVQALSRIWYIASLIYMPAWALKELSFAVFDFFWKTKRELVARAVVLQPASLGGYSVVDIRFKTLSLVSQWVKRFILAPCGWSFSMSFWCFSCFKVSPVTVFFSNPSLFKHTLLPPFYSSLLLAWCALQGSCLSSLVFAADDPLAIPPVLNLSARSAYQFLLAVNYTIPHCVVKFRPLFGDLYWSSTWQQLYFSDFDRSILDFSWKVAHGVVYTDLDLHVTLLGKELRPVVSARDLGVYMDATLSFDEHITSVTSSCLSSLSQINRIKHLLDRNTLVNVINALVFSKLYYCSSVWSSTTKKNIKKLQNVQNFAARIITRSRKFDRITPVLKELKWLSVQSMLIYRDCVLVFKCLRGFAPDYLAKMFKKRSEIHNKDTRNKNKMDIPRYRTAAGQRTFYYRAVSLWNNLPGSLTELANLALFKKELMRHLQREC